MNNSFEQNEQHWKVLVLLLKQIAREKRITHQVIAQRTGLLASNVSRVFSLKFCPSLKVFIAIANAVGMNFFFEDRDNTDIELNVLFERAMTELGRRPDSLPGN